jgi:hypothetical protein
LETYRVGDSVTPRGIFEAIHEGSMVGRIIWRKKWDKSSGEK